MLSIEMATSWMRKPTTVSLPLERLSQVDFHEFEDSFVIDGFKASLLYVVGPREALSKTLFIYSVNLYFINLLKVTI